MLRPDLVLGWQSGNRAADIERLEALGLPIFVSESRRLADVPATLRRLGELAGTEATAERAARAFEARLARLTPQRKAPVSVFVEIWHRPLMTVNGTHLISEVLATCGGYNVFDGMPALSGSVAMESVLGADPQVIIAATPPGLDVLADWRALPRLRAVQTGRVHAIDPNLLTRATPRILDGLEQVCAWLGT
jgi:iron complex transport system substrate-binding protein